MCRRDAREAAASRTSISSPPLYPPFIEFSVDLFAIRPCARFALRLGKDIAGTPAFEQTAQKATDRFTTRRTFERFRSLGVNPADLCTYDYEPNLSIEPKAGEPERHPPPGDLR